MPTLVSERPKDDSRRRRIAHGRLLRRVWRVHFYAGAIAGPFLLLLALTGLVILYTQPIQDAVHHDLLRVTPGTSTVGLQQQVDAALTEFPGATVDTVIPPLDGSHSTLVSILPPDSTVVTDVYVNPYTGVVLGSMIQGDDLVGLANRLHGFLNNESVTVTLPSLSHWIAPDDHPESTVHVPLGSLILEIITVWSLVLAITGLYLWWPRATQKGKRLFGVRWSKGGRLRWQDMHASSGILVAGFLTIFVVSGMPWSDYWGADWTTAASKMTPNATVDTASTPAKMGDLDRLGRHVVWSTRTDDIPASGAPASDEPARLDYTDIAKIAELDGMLPGYSIIPPSDTADAHHGETAYGSFVLSNYWPQKLSEQRTLYLDQFTGNTIADSTTANDGLLEKATNYGVNLHMGTQYGLITRILATLGALLVITSVLTSSVMWWKRRPSGTAGLPKRPVRSRELQAIGTPAITLIGALLAMIYPSFGVTLLVVVGLDLAVSGIGRLRRGRPQGPDDISPTPGTTAESTVPAER